MPQSNPPDKIPVTLHLPAEVAVRLKLAAESQKRPAAELAVELLDRYLPRPHGPKKGSIPYA
ncbi:MAG: ribbon-helix-helix domain-containing protein [Planctomycetaceae bacterium]|nr:ribbon-helix-helix domain-containing protein [Planctomycetaceae bacterium]